MSDRPPIPPEWHGILNTLTECTTYAGAGLGKTEWLALRAAITPEKPEPAHDPEVVGAVTDARHRVGLTDSLRSYVQVTWDLLDALADEGYEVVQLTEVEARAKSQLIMAGWASSVDVDDLHERIAELAAENRALEARNAKLAAQNNSLWANLGGGDADDREASEGSAAPASSLPPSSADHFAPDDEGNTDHGGWFPPADEDGRQEDAVSVWRKGYQDGWNDCAQRKEPRAHDVTLLNPEPPMSETLRDDEDGTEIDIDRAAEAARAAWRRAPADRGDWLALPEYMRDVWRNVVRAVREHDAARTTLCSSSDGLTTDVPAERPSNRQPSSDWPDDAAVERASQVFVAQWDLGRPLRIRLRAALVAAGPPPFASADVVADMLDERDALRAELEVAKGLIRLVSDSTRALWQGGDGWEWEVHPSYVTPEQARYIESCVGGESE